MLEHEIIRWIRERTASNPHVAVGPGDDCAHLRMNGSDLAVSIDTINSGVHFKPDEDPYRIGWKAAASALSDIAAAGCEPVGVTVSCSLPPETKQAYMQSLFDGMDAVVQKFGISIAGGELAVQKEGLSIAVTVMGKVPPEGMLKRSGARAGDIVYVTGALGGSIKGRHLECLPRIHEALKLRRISIITAMIDISDGLISELRHIANESGLQIDIDAEAIPLSADTEGSQTERISQALGDGEDFELLFCIAPAGEKALLEEWDDECPLHRIGICQEGAPAVNILNADGSAFENDAAAGYQHEW